MTRNFENHIRNVPNFPKPGILFKDITPLLENAEAFQEVINAFKDRYQNVPFTKIVGIESRGFIFGAALAYALKKGIVVARKQGKLPAQTVSFSYDLEYGSATLEIHADAIKKGEKVLVMDDLLATGGTANATCNLVEKMGGEVIECAFLVELKFLKGRSALGNRAVFSLIEYE